MQTALSSGGQPLDRATRGFFEPRLNHDLSAVRIHANDTAAGSARAVDAKAYTIGNDIVFGRDEYRPGTESGKHLLAHELAHVTQQPSGSGTMFRRLAAEKDQAPDFIGPIAAEIAALRGQLGLHANRDASFPKGSSPDNFTPADSEQDRTYQRLLTLEGKQRTQLGASGQSVEHANLKLRSRSPKGNTKVDAAIEMAREAIILATDTPPDNALALDRLRKVESFLAPLVGVRNIQKYYSDGTSRTFVDMISGGAVAAVGSLQSLIRIGRNSTPRGRNGGLWDHEFSRLALARDQLAILSGEEHKGIAQMIASEKLTIAINRAIGKLPGEVAERLKELITPEAIAVMVAMTTAFVISQLTPVGWVADILVAGLIVATVYMVGTEASEIVKLLLKFIDKAAGARSESDLDEAADALATAISKAGVDIVAAILFHKAGKALDLKPPGPRSPGIVEVMTKAGGKFTTWVSEPFGARCMVTADGPLLWTPAEPAPGLLMMEAKAGTGGAKGSGGSGKLSGKPVQSQPPAGKKLAGGLAPKGGLAAEFANGFEIAKNWLGKKIKPGDDLPDGYHWRQEEIVRSAGKKEANYTPLEVRDGKVAIGSGGERISNPSKMNRNFAEAVRQEIADGNAKLSEDQVKAKAAKVIDQSAVHHLIPDNIVQDHPLAKAAREAGYDLDQGSNLKGLAKNEALTDPKAAEPGHWSSHPKYDAIVWEQLDRMQFELEKKFGSLAETPVKSLMEAMRKVETRMRKLIEKGEVPKDAKGRLTELSPQQTDSEDDEAYG